MSKQTKCADCGETGGRFRFMGDGTWKHVGCSKAAVYHRKPIFPYTTTHFEPNNGPVEIQSLRHLRKLERQYGVASEPFNMDQSYQGEKY